MHISQPVICSTCGIHRRSRAAGGRLHQEPVPELAELRLGHRVTLKRQPVEPGAAAKLQGIQGPSLDVALTLHRGDSSAGGLVVRAWLRSDTADAEPTAAAVIVDWHAQTLEVGTLNLNILCAKKTLSNLA